MSIALALQESPGDEFSNGDFSAPLCFTFDGVLGGEKEVHLLIKNTSSVSAVTVTEITSTSVANHPNDIELVEFKLTEEGDYSSTITDSLQIDASSSQSVYMKIKVPSGRLVTSIEDIGLKVTY